MDKYELLLDKVSGELPVLEGNLLKNTGNKGMYEDNVIFLERNISWIEKRIHLSEEYSHHRTSVGNILDYTTPEGRKQEWIARRDSVERLVTLDDLIECSSAGYHTKYACAEYLDITEEFLEEVIDHYFSKYGAYHLYKDYLFIFNDSSLFVVKAGLKLNQGAIL